MVRNHDGLVWISMDDSHLLMIHIYYPTIMSGFTNLVGFDSIIVIGMLP